MVELELVTHAVFIMLGPNGHKTSAQLISRWRPDQTDLASQTTLETSFWNLAKGVLDAKDKLAVPENHKISQTLLRLETNCRDKIKRTPHPFEKDYELTLWPNGDLQLKNVSN